MVKTGTVYKGTKWKILGEDHRVGGRVYYSCICLGCQDRHVVAFDNMKSGKSSQCRSCSLRDRWGKDSNATARANPRLYSLWWHHGGVKSGWKTAAEFFSWYEANPPSPGARLIKINARKAHGPENSTWLPCATERYIKVIADCTGKSLKAVRTWASSVSKRYVAIRAKRLLRGEDKK